MVRSGLYQIAHYQAYESLHGSIPAGLTIDHLCRNKRCIEPTHLEAVTNEENARRNARALWDARGVTPEVIAARTLRGPNWDFCKNGHPAINGSWLISTSGFKTCKVCARDSRQRSKKAASLT